MLTISRKFTLGFHPQFMSIIQEKLQEFSITILGTKYNENKICGVDIIKVYLECMGNEEDLEKLMDYLRTDFEHRASIIF